MSIEISDKAKAQLNNLYENSIKGKALRIYISSYGWGGPSFGLALEELGEDQETIKVDDYNFVLDDGLSQRYKNFWIDYGDNWLRRGFLVVPR